MSEGFEKELAALRGEVADFVLQVLRSERDGALLDDIAAKLTDRLSRDLEVTAELDERDREALQALKDRLADFAPDGAAAGPVEGSPAQPGLVVRRRVEAPESGRSGRRRRMPEWMTTWGPWAGIGVLTLAVAALIAFVLLRPPRLASAPPGDPAAQVQAAPDPQTRWREIVDYAANLPDPAQAKARVIALCGTEIAQNCPTFAMRAEALKSEAQARRQAYAALSATLVEMQACTAPADAAAAPQGWACPLAVTGGP